MADLCWDYGFDEVDTGLVNMQPKSVVITIEEDSEGDTSTSWSTGQSGICIMDQWKSAVDESSPCSTSSQCGAPICRQFWKAGIYNDDLDSVSKSHGGSSYLQLHPKFLHSNATSHKWTFGAIAELLDNAVDEIQNGATYVIIDKILNPRNGSPALLIQDDGAGMEPEAIKKCLSFGFSDKKAESSIGKYGNGFKTSSMRLGADAIVFTRTLVDQTLIQSVGLLSYTFLTRSGYDRIVVPMVHYKFNIRTKSFESLVQPKSDGHSNINISVLLQWSPYSTEEELLKQFDDIGHHGTKIIIYNLWLDNDGNMELDFESDPEDIHLAWDEKHNAEDDHSNKAITDNHIANRLRYSLRGSVITAIGFLKEAPQVKVHGFNIYHRSRLILPFFPVVHHNRGRGVVGVLEANFIEPTHSKQDFEKTNVFQKLITRLNNMTHEYWDYHCGLLGYTVPKKARLSFASDSCPKEGSKLKRKLADQPECSPSESVATTPRGTNTDQKKTILMQENKRLKQQCLELEKGVKELDLKVMNLKTVLEDAQKEYANLLIQLQLLEKVKVRKPTKKMWTYK